MGSYTIPCRCCGPSAGPTCEHCGGREWILTVTGTVSNPAGEAILGVFSLRISYESAFAECDDGPCRFYSPVIEIEGERYLWSVEIQAGGVNALVLKPWPADYEDEACEPDGICRCNNYDLGVSDTATPLNCTEMSGTLFAFVGGSFGSVNLDWTLVPA